jgi:hypothetical protein
VTPPAIYRIRKNPLLVRLPVSSSELQGVYEVARLLPVKMPWSTASLFADPIRSAWAMEEKGGRKGQRSWVAILSLVVRIHHLRIAACDRFL